MRRGMSAGRAHALRLLIGGDRQPEERTAPAAAGAGAGVRLARGEGGALPRVVLPLHELANHDFEDMAGGIDAALSNAVAFRLQCYAARAASVLPSRPDAWGAPGVRDPDRVTGALLCGSCQVEDACRVDVHRSPCAKWDPPM